jgi:hypothetical protein
MDTLLDRHLLTFDRWFQAHLMYLTASSWPHYHLTVVALLDQLDPKIFDWSQVEAILQYPWSSMPSNSRKLHNLFLGPTFNMDFIRIVSKFLTDRDRAGSLWLNSYHYADFATYILEILGDK